MTLPLKKCLLFLLLAVVISGTASSQSLRFTRYTEEEGLPSPLVKSITSDSNGILWAATDDGLVRFDGRDFRLFRDELPGAYAKSVLALPGGQLLVTTDMGVARVTDKAGDCTFETIARGSVKQSDTAMWYPKMLFSDAKGRIWLSDNFRIYRYTGKGFKSYDPGPGVVTNNFNRSFSFTDDGNGNLIAVSETGLVFIYNDKTDKFKPVALPSPIPGVHAAFSNAPGLLLIATREGLFELIMDKTGSVKHLRIISPLEISYLAKSGKGMVFAGTWSNGLYTISKDKSGGYAVMPVSQFTEKDVAHLFIDQEDNVWVASDIGILLLQETLFGETFSSLTNAYIQHISIGQKNIVYFTDGSAVFRSQTGSSVTGKELFRTSAVVLQVIPDKNGLWLADATGAITYTTFTGAVVRRFDFSDQGRAIFKMVKDNDGNIWACQDVNPGIIRILPDFTTKSYGPDEGLFSRAIALTLSGSGELYAGGMTDSAFLLVYNSYIDKFINLSERIEFERNIDINVNDIACDPHSNDIWLGTSFGLIRLHKGSYKRVDLGNLTENSVKAVAIDSLGYVWFANNQGLHRYRNGNLMSFNERTGLPAKTVSYRGLMVDGHNRLWVGTVAGLAVSSPLRHPRKTLSPAIRSIMINNFQADFAVAASFSFSNKGFVNLKVSSPEFPARYLSYERWIEGYDRGWVVLPKDGEILLGSMKPGNYILKVRALQSGNYFYSDPTIVRFQVKRIWYERWYVILLALAVLSLIFVMSTRRHSRRLRIDNEKLELIISDRTQEIVKQRDQIEQQNKRISHKNEALSLKNKELEQAKNLAEEAAKAKSQFLSVMSHEIRTPMNAVIGITHLLMRDNPRPEQLEDLKILKFSAENLLGLINDVLDLNKIEAGKLVIEAINFNLKNLAGGVHSSMLHRAKEKGIEFRFEYDELLPVYVVSDPLRIAQLLNNLVSNAIKFTDKGGVLLEIRLVGRKVDKVDVEFIVSDTGIGIPDEMHQRIFGAFTQASSETSRKYGGTGLGLAITSKLLEMLGSSIRLKSEPGEGSEFSFVLTMPEGQIRKHNEEPAFSEMDNYSFAGQRILLVEDNKINELIARKFMEEWNLKVDSAYNGLEAIEKLNQENYRLILMDLQMPEMDGYKTASIIRSRGVEPYVSIPIIALTASSKSEVHEKISLAGMNDFISKPFNPAELFSKLRTYLDER
ncbi:MAG: PAS/PAC sensor hybrid histidine kinase [Bacteroidetes bacterium]|nr:MAG: PAS/PAC sensor hybrid histidine kinase [Bacteroidota bacterium]